MNPLTTSFILESRTIAKTKRFILVSTAALSFCGALMLNNIATAEGKQSALTASEEKFVKLAAASGMAEVKIASLAEVKALNPDVKAFAEMIVKDHTAVNTELKDLAASKKVELSTVIAPSQATTYQKLEKVSGGEFDKAFIADMTASHMKGIALYEKASKESKDKELKSLVDKTIPALKAHLEKAKALNSKSLAAKELIAK